MVKEQICINTSTGYICYQNKKHATHIRYQVTYQLLGKRPALAARGTLPRNTTTAMKVAVLFGAVAHIPAHARRSLRIGGWSSITRKVV